MCLSSSSSSSSSILLLVSSRSFLSPINGISPRSNGTFHVLSLLSFFPPPFQCVGSTKTMCQGSKGSLFLPSPLTRTYTGGSTTSNCTHTQRWESSFEKKRAPQASAACFFFLLGRRRPWPQVQSPFDGSSFFFKRKKFVCKFLGAASRGKFLGIIYRNVWWEHHIKNLS